MALQGDDPTRRSPPPLVRPARWQQSPPAVSTAARRRGGGSIGPRCGAGHLRPDDRVTLMGEHAADIGGPERISRGRVARSPSERRLDLRPSYGPAIRGRSHGPSSVDERSVDGEVVQLTGLGSPWRRSAAGNSASGGEREVGGAVGAGVDDDDAVSCVRRQRCRRMSSAGISAMRRVVAPGEVVGVAAEAPDRRVHSRLRHGSGFDDAGGGCESDRVSRVVRRARARGRRARAGRRSARRPGHRRESRGSGR